MAHNPFKETSGEELLECSPIRLNSNYVTLEFKLILILNFFISSKKIRPFLTSDLSLLSECVVGDGEDDGRARLALVLVQFSGGVLLR